MMVEGLHSLEDRFCLMASWCQCWICHSQFQGAGRQSYIHQLSHLIGPLSHTRGLNNLCEVTNEEKLTQ